MKKTNEKDLKRLLIITILLLGVFGLNSQNSQITFESNISLPEISSLGTTDYASGAIDIITANNQVYVYTMDKILVLSANGQSISATIPLYKPQPGNTDPFTKKYGKFNPIFDNSRTYIADITFMTIFKNTSAGNREDLFVVTPNLDILLINTDNNTVTESFNVSSDIPHLKPLHGVCILKYDDVHNRLYWLIKGRQDVDPNSQYGYNCTGHFHFREVYFAIYNVSTNGTITTTPFYLFNEKTIPLDKLHYMNKNISDFEINSNSILGEDDYFYLAKYNKIEVWGIDNSDNVTIMHEIPVDNLIYGFDGNGIPNYYKFSKLLYINHPGVVHKVVALPYSYSDINMVDPLNHPPRVYILDCENTNVPTSTFKANSFDSIDSPNQNVYDAVYLPVNQDLAMCFSANPDKQLSTVDIVVYDFNPNHVGWLNPIASLSTSLNPISGIDINTPTNLLKVNNEVLVSKKDEVIRLYPTGNTYNVSTAPLVSGENNFFRRGTHNPSQNKSFIINSAGGKIESFSNVNSIIAYFDYFNTSYIAHHITSNHLGTKQYFFNKLNIENSGFFVYETDGTTSTTFNVNDDNDNNNNFLSPIGDCIYNEFTNEFLVSQNTDFGSSPTSVKRYNSDNQVVGEIFMTETTGENYQYAKEMYIDPNGILYVMVNTKVESITDPKLRVLIFDATNNYMPFGSLELTLPTIVNNAEYFLTNFCYSKSDNMVYLTVTPQGLSLVPYQSEFNTMINPNNDPTNLGCLFSIEEINSDYILIKEKDNLINPGKIICPDDGDDSHLSEYEGKLYILTNSLYVFVKSNKSAETISRALNDIIYSPINDKLYGFINEPGTCNSDRKAVIYEITVNLPYDFTRLFEYPGQIASFFLSPANEKLYLHTKFDNEKLGSTASQLVTYNLLTTQDNAIDLQDYDNGNGQNKASYPEFDHCNDYHFYNYTLTTPYYNTKLNKIYLPNGAHSNVSVVDINFEELSLNPGITWLSFPRLENNPGSTTPAQTVLGPFANGVGNILPQNFVSGPQGFSSYLINLLEDENVGAEDYLYWNDQVPEWSITGSDLTTIKSTLGYKINLSLEEERILRMQGILEDADSEITLHSGEFKENWVGYWLYESQSPFDAIPEIVLDELTVIKAQTWCCVKRWDLDGSQTPTWVCAVHKDSPTLDYGDMVILETDSDINFQWQTTGNTTSSVSKLETEYYQFTEQADYISFFIELDTTENPQEIAAFVGDSCIGASTVLTEDTIVLIPGYTEEISGDVVFEEYYGSQKSTRPEINEYLVSHYNDGTWKKRTINTDEKQDHYFISFKSDREEIKVDNRPVINIFPNPVNNTLNINYNIKEKARVNIRIFDSFGRHVITLLNSTRNEGFHDMTWNLTGNCGDRLNNGVYMIKLSIGDMIISKKVVIN